MRFPNCKIKIILNTDKSTSTNKLTKYFAILDYLSQCVDKKKRTEQILFVDVSTEHHLTRYTVECNPNNSRLYGTKWFELSEHSIT